MTTRERFQRVLHWQKPDRVPNMEFGYWDETILCWHKQGLPERIKTNEDLERYLGLEGISLIPDVPAKNGLFPEYEEKVVEDRRDRRVIVDKEGNLCEVLSSGSSIPRYIRHGLQTREDWERLRNERLNPASPGRIGDVACSVDDAHEAGMPIRFDAGSLYGWLRNWMGVENLSVAIMTDRSWVEEMMNHLVELTLDLIDRGISGHSVDVAWWWEDMCFQHGPLISPKLFEELMVPRYERVTFELKRHGIDVNVLDCDGRIYELVPGWLRGGINCMFPIESLHTDPLKVREEFGESVLLVGGVNKVRLIEGQAAIDRELERLEPLVAQGGYIPCVDHRVPPDVAFENYLYYLEKKRAIL